jgi:hypothetical protein
MGGSPEGRGCLQAGEVLTPAHSALAGRSTNEPEKSRLNICIFFHRQLLSKMPSPRTFACQHAFERVKGELGTRGVHGADLSRRDGKIPPMNQIVSRMDAQGQPPRHAAKDCVVARAIENPHAAPRSKSSFLETAEVFAMVTIIYRRHGDRAVLHFNIVGEHCVVGDGAKEMLQESFDAPLEARRG